MIIRQLAIIFGCLALGELIIFLTGLPIPSSIVGMLLLTAALKFKILRLEWVQGISDFLVGTMGFFFVPPGVAVMLHFKLIQAELWPILTATIVSTLLVLAVTGWVHQCYSGAERRVKQKFGKNKDDNTVKNRDEEA